MTLETCVTVGAASLRTLVLIVELEAVAPGGGGGGERIFPDVPALLKLVSTCWNGPREYVRRPCHVSVRCISTSSQLKLVVSPHILPRSGGVDETAREACSPENVAVTHGVNRTLSEDDN